MRKKLNFAILFYVLLTALGVSDCAHGTGQFENAPVNKIEGEHKMQTLKININGQRFTAMLYDNAATQKLVQNLPVTLNMKDLHGNEKYYYLDTSLPAKAQHIGKINAGDIMLFGSDCLVVFYESFNTSYSYTPIGKIENASGLKKDVGRGRVKVEFSL